MVAKSKKLLLIGLLLTVFPFLFVVTGGAAALAGPFHSEGFAYTLIMLSYLVGFIGLLILILGIIGSLIKIIRNNRRSFK